MGMKQTWKRSTMASASALPEPRKSISARQARLPISDGCGVWVCTMAGLPGSPNSTAYTARPWKLVPICRTVPDSTVCSQSSISV